MSGKKRVSFKATQLRIVAGTLGSRRIEYNGDPDTRPMKEKTREALFSLLGGYLNNTYAIDLFAGTGVLGFEAISRGASGALLLEYSRPTVSTLLANMRSLDLGERVQIQNVDTLRWLRSAVEGTSHLPRQPWVVFCCPPYSMWKKQTSQLSGGLINLRNCAPDDSRFVCETEVDFDLAAYLPNWTMDVRDYKPARIWIG